MVRADVDHAGFAELRDTVLAGPADHYSVVRSPVLARTLPGGDRVALSQQEDVVFRVDAVTGAVRVLGTAAHAVSRWAARLVRELARAELERSGWAVMHASAVVRDGQAILTVGAKGAGKTTTAFLLALRGDWDLLANDRVFVRRDGDRIEARPWPSAVALGLGLLDALGLFDVVRERVLAGETLHETQDQCVTDAIRAGRRDPLWDDRGRELKIQMLPGQLEEWFGIRHVCAGRVALVFSPRVRPAAVPGSAPSTPVITDGDFFRANDEMYPDFLRLALITPERRDDIYRRAHADLLRLPGATGSLSHDLEGNLTVLSGLMRHVR